MTMGVNPSLPLPGEGKARGCALFGGNTFMEHIERTPFLLKLANTPLTPLERGTFYLPAG